MRHTASRDVVVVAAIIKLSCDYQVVPSLHTSLGLINMNHQWFVGRASSASQALTVPQLDLQLTA